MSADEIAKAPLVSIGIPALNAEKYVIETLNSVENQTYENIELIFVDDGSIDNTYEMVKNWAGKSRLMITILKNTQNLGLTKSCNILLAHAKGKYFQKLDSDDIIMPDKIERQVKILESCDDKTALVYSEVNLINENGEVLSDDYYTRIGYKKENLQDFYEALLNINFIPNPSVLLRTKVIRELNGYDESLMGEDWDMWLKISSKYRFICDNRKTSCYRISSNSMMMNPRNRISLNSSLIKMFKNNLEYNNSYKHLIWEKLHNLITYSFYLGDPESGKHLKWYLSNKLNLKMTCYLLLFSVGLKHPSFYFKKTV